MPRRIRTALIGSAWLVVVGVAVWAFTLAGHAGPLGAAPRAACSGSGARRAAGTPCGAAHQGSARAVAATVRGPLPQAGAPGAAKTAVPVRATAAQGGARVGSARAPSGTRSSASHASGALSPSTTAPPASPGNARAAAPAAGTRIPAPTAAPRPEAGPPAVSAPRATPSRSPVAGPTSKASGRAADGTPASPAAASRTLGVLVVGLAGGAPVASAAVLLPPGTAEVVPLAASGTTGGAGVLRAYTSGGLGGAQAAAQSLLGDPVPYGVVVDLAALAGAVDAVGGMPYDLPAPVRFHNTALGLRLHLAAGPRELDGAETLALLRWCADGFGAGSPDCAGQRFAGAVVNRLLHPPLEAIPRLLGLMEPAIRTDMGLGALTRLAAAVLAGHRALTFSPGPAKEQVAVPGT